MLETNKKPDFRLRHYHPRRKKFNEVAWLPSNVAELKAEADEAIARLLGECKDMRVRLTNLRRKAVVTSSRFPNGRPSDRAGRQAYKEEFIKLREQMKTARSAEIDDLRGVYKARMKELGEWKRTRYWLTNFNNKRLPFSKNRSHYDSAIWKGVDNLFTPQEKYVLQALRSGKGYMDIADDLQVHPKKVWQTFRTALASLSNEVGQKVYQARWLVPFNDFEENWSTWQPRS